MSLSKTGLVLLALIATGRLVAQSASGPVLTTPPSIQYPPIAKAAHVEGEVVVRFSIDTDGLTDAVQSISGPAMLRLSVEGQIRQWHFKLPLPINAQHDFEATYKFSRQDGSDAPDDLDGPPNIPSGGGSIVLGGFSLAGTVRSLDGSQTIDVSPAPPKPFIPCPQQTDKVPPAVTSGDDFVELYRASCMRECRNYRVRIDRKGQVTWQGREDVSMIGIEAARIQPETAASLLDDLQASSFWSQCSVPMPSPYQDVTDDDFRRDDYLTVSIGGTIKTVDTDYRVSDADNGAKFAWAIDKLADTHQWRHGNAVTESFDNMFDDLLLPKPGMTALIRSIERVGPQGEFNLQPLKLLLQAGADPNAADESGWTALMYVVKLTGDSRAVKLFLDAHANINQASLHGDTALMVDAHRGLLNKELLSHGADINRQNNDGVSALMLLAQYGQFNQLKDALAAGADPTAHDTGGHNALDYLRAASCLKFLIPLSAEQLRTAFSPDDPEHPVPCPSTDSTFLEDRSLLESAIGKAPAR